MAKVINKEIPCRIGDKVYAIRNYKGHPKVEYGTVSEMFYVGEEMSLCIVVHNIVRGYWGKNVFGNEKEASEKIALDKQKRI